MAEFSGALDRVPKMLGVHESEMEVDAVGDQQQVAEHNDNNHGYFQQEAIADAAGAPVDWKANGQRKHPGILSMEDSGIDDWDSNDVRGSLEALNQNAVPPNSPEPGSANESFACTWQERAALHVAGAEGQLVAHVECISLKAATAKQPASKKIFSSGESGKKFNGIAARRHAVDGDDVPRSVLMLDSVREKKKMAK